ncbi:SRPBCC family protein [Hyalangium gracile]|uniref:SRPBCC family protein n=1 Tax=Hyalangium gracile TaxID=394092 RepID=UPI001CCA7B7D|nr:SRPBCC family protein [Hyalangium gracile]
MIASVSSETAAPRNLTTMELKAEREIIISRTFNGPARIVFDAWTRPELVKRWWAPKSHCVEVVGCEADVRVGGKYRYTLRRDTGDQFSFYGEYSELTPHSRLVYTQIFEPFPDSPVVVTVTLTERNGKTHLVSHELYPSKEAREGALASGMEHGMRETMDQLDELVASLR